VFSFQFLEKRHGIVFNVVLSSRDDRCTIGALPRTLSSDRSTEPVQQRLEIEPEKMLLSVSQSRAINRRLPWHSRPSGEEFFRTTERCTQFAGADNKIEMRCLMNANLLENDARTISGRETQPVETVSRIPCNRRIGRLPQLKSETLQRVISPLMLVVWCLWWSASVYQKNLIGFAYSWCGNPCFNCDFFAGGYGPAQVWLQGKDAYAETGWLFFIYPPPVLRMFAWCGLFSYGTAVAVWVTALASIAAIGAYLAWKTRTQLGLCEMTLPTAMALILFSTPVIFALERGNCDSLSVLFVIVGLSLWRLNSPVAQFLAGAILSLAPWLKLYPGLLGFGCIGLRRWQALAGFIVGGLAIGALHTEEIPKFIRNNRQLTEEYYRQSMAKPNSSVHPSTHSLTQSWSSIWTYTPFKFLSQINGFVAAFVILGTPLGWVTYHVYKSPVRDRVAFPFMIWIIALATFVPPAANDYSLVFLPIAAVAVWDRKDPLYVQLMMLALMIWWQPLGLPVSGRLLLVIKVCGLIAVGISLVRRVTEISGPIQAPEVARAIAG
jgi:hypothetical protein